uniref:ATP synthase F0 subunit 6 n=1 Tax=Capsaloides cristatus TaxID=1101449 RepID=A0A6M3R7M3_9PLAT|nr:ATP synthase F0 subunit 6 [Capsaloides cristatus]
MIMNNFLPFVFSNFLGSINNLSSFYKSMGLFIAGSFIILRAPYSYGTLGFLFSILVFIGPLFCGIFFSRLESSVTTFLSSLVPPGTPLFIAPLVCLAETISFIVRPLVLMLRPFLNITIGGLGGMSLGLMAIGNKAVLAFLCLLFLYEVFVAVVHWFIVINILGFSIDH